MKDSHVHTVLSHDGRSTMREYLRAAAKTGVDEITFTEHYDIYDGVKTSLHTLDAAAYREAFDALPPEKGVRANCGIEIGLRPECREKIRAMTEKNSFDFIIGSSHITAGKDMSFDPSFFEGKTRREAYLVYFREILENIRLFDDFDVYGHLDYVVRYGGYPEKELAYGEFREALEEILDLLIEKGKGLEVNSSGYRYGLSSPHPNLAILKRFREKGGEIVTLGSDAHRVEQLAAGIPEAAELLREAGFARYAVFRERKPVLFAL
ncbi:MAG: histidinol-phosphatase HisJ family protein [Clostridia bacterium]|nr:histidinol-phosphatase HisJ family protein [Clostridia bacterium]